MTAEELMLMTPKELEDLMHLANKVLLQKIYRPKLIPDVHQFASK